MKEIFLKSVGDDKGMFFEIENDSMNISLWKKANSTTVSLDSEAVLDLGKFIQENFSITKELTNEERFEVKRQDLLNQYVAQKDLLIRENTATRDILETKIQNLEADMEKQLQRALDNPLANR